MLNEKTWRRYVLIECHLIWSMTLKFSKLTLKNRWKWWNLHNFYNQQRKPKIERVKEIAIKTIAKGTKKRNSTHWESKWRTLFVCLMIFCVIIFSMQMYGWMFLFSIISSPYLVLSHTLLRPDDTGKIKSLLLYHFCACSFVRVCACITFIVCIYEYIVRVPLNGINAFVVDDVVVIAKTRNDKLCVFFALKFNS